MVEGHRIDVEQRRHAAVGEVGGVVGLGDREPQRAAAPLVDGL
jgi:hypothetical protein